MTRSAVATMPVLCVLLVCCGCSSKPSDSIVFSAVTVALEDGVPVSWVGNLMGGEDPRIASIEIDRWGDYNSDQEYWPVKVHVVGTAALRDPFNRGKRVTFDKVADVRLRRDDYGKWIATISGGMFQ